MVRMYFDSDRAFAFLDKNQFVFTCRPSDFEKKNLPAIGKVEIYRHGKPAGLAGNKVLVWMFSILDGKNPEVSCRDAMEVYVRNSGFSSTSEWMAEAERLSGKREDWAIWYVHVSDVDRGE